MSGINVLLCCVCTSGDDTSGLAFATSLLTFLKHAEGHHTIKVNFVTNISSALDMFAREPQFNRLVLCNTRCNLNLTFIQNALTSKHPFVTGVIPNTVIDWEKVKAAACSHTSGDGSAISKEDISFAGLSYNVNLNQRDTDGNVKETTLQTVVLRRAVIAKILKSHAEEVVGEPQHDFYSNRIRHGKFLTADQNFCHMWGGPIYADVANPINIMGPMAFMGTVGARSVLR